MISLDNRSNAFDELLRKRRLCFRLRYKFLYSSIGEPGVMVKEVSEFMREHGPCERIIAVNDRQFHDRAERERFWIGDFELEHVGFEETHDIIKRVLKGIEEAR